MTKNTASQQEAIDKNAPRILCVAGPGSGKTYVVIQRICRLINTGTDANQIVCITFTNAAAKEIQTRLEAECPGTRLGYLGTLHGYCLKQLQAHGQRLGYAERITVLDAEQADEMLVETARELGCKASLKRLTEVRAEMCVNRPRTPEEIAVSTYLRKLRSSSSVDFETILRDFRELLLTGAVPWIGHLIVDEFQDSGAIDIGIYAAITAAHRFFVGDSDQAIYSWRGGDMTGILSIAKSSDWHVIKLEGNFRSVLEICAAANQLISHNKDRIWKTTQPMRDVHGTVDAVGFATDIDEQSELLHDIRSLIVKEGQNANEIAVLGRTNAIVTEYAKNAEAMGIPVRKKKMAKMPDDWAVARAGLELLNSPNSVLTQRQFLRLKFGAERARSFERTAALAQTHSMAEHIPGLTIGCPLNSIGQALARLDVSRESIELIEAQRDLLTDPDFTTLSFALARDLESTSELGDGVTFTTIHSSKGREWETVFVVGCEQEIMPGTAKSRNIEEERRLAFVAFTRAKDALVISHAKARRATFGQKRPQPATPSQFIREAGQ